MGGDAQQGAMPSLDRSKAAITATKREPCTANAPMFLMLHHRRDVAEASTLSRRARNGTIWRMPVAR